jgi:hypothetical protein
MGFLLAEYSSRLCRNRSQVDKLTISYCFLAD